MLDTKLPNEFLSTKYFLILITRYTKQIFRKQEIDNFPEVKYSKLIIKLVHLI